MRRAFFNFKTIILLSVLLFAIILAQSILEYNSSRKAVMDLLNNQADALILSVARAGAKGLIAYEIQQGKITDHLFTVAEMVDRLDRRGLASRDELADIIAGNELALLAIIDSRRKTVYSSFPDDLSYDDPLIQAMAPVISGESNKAALGFRDVPGVGRSYLVALGRRQGGAILAGIRADELLALRRTFGAGSVIDDISQSPGVRYAGIIRDGFILAASDNFPQDSADAWYRIRGGADDSIKTRITENRPAIKGTVFEAIGPFTVTGELYGEIVIGLDTGYLDLLTARLKRDIVGRSLIFLIVAVVAIGGILLRQNYKLLTKQYTRIQHEVQTLEQDKALSARFVAMGELASGVAHEIRNPLNAIRVIIQRLQREFKPQYDIDEYNELTGIIKKETDRINSSVEQFLAFARPPVLHRSVGDINDCVRDVAALFEPRANQRNCVLRTELGHIPEMNFDKELCRQAILNLLENALAAVDSHGIIALRTFRKGDRCVMEIADNGPGIPDDKKPRVFDLYYTTKPTGTGVGLPTVLRIVNEHGGRMELLDAPAGGALFRLEFPLD